MKQITKLLILLSVLFAFDCKGKKTNKQNPANNEYYITANDQMRYNIKEFSVTTGKPVKITLTHIGKMPKSSMGHNFVLLKQGTDVDKFAAAASEAKDTGFVPADSKDVIAQTKLLGGGESDKITFEPPPAGVYDYLCTFPGHYGLMRGKLIVKESA